VSISIDDSLIEAPSGQTILVALLSHRKILRQRTTDGPPAAGFCLMGACQECWLWLDDGSRVRACTTPVRAGMKVLTTPQAGFPLL
jgi:NADH dehydrogenase/NADH:ubiquinone oxidoreductase subunit G